MQLGTQKKKSTFLITKNNKIFILSRCINSVCNRENILVSYVSLVTQAPWQDFLPSKNYLIGVDDEASVATPLDPVQLSMEGHNCFRKWTMENLFDRVQKANKQ